MTSFKEYIIESSVDDRIMSVIKQLLKAKTVVAFAAPRDRQKYRMTAHKYVDTVNGPWVLKKYENADKQFVQADPPKESTLTKKFFRSAI